MDVYEGKNVKFNNFRSVPFAEIENEHMFRAQRHFPELAQSMRELTAFQKSKGRDHNDTSYIAPRLPPRKVQLKSTSHMDTLTKSNLGELNAIDGVRSMFMKERTRQREMRAAERRQPTKQTEKTPLQRADQKLTMISLSYDSRAINNDLKGFQHQPLTEEELDVQLKRCLNINLTTEELYALHSSMDADGNGTIDGVEFTRYFFALGNALRERLRHKQRVMDEAAAADRQRRMEEEERRRRVFEESQSSSQFSSDDTDRAMRRLAEVALQHDPSKFMDQLMTNGFNRHLTPYMFLTQLQNSFALKLTPPEYGALVHRFQTRPGEHPIDGTLFIKRFMALHRQMHIAHRRQAELDKERRRKVMAKGPKFDLFPSSLGR